MSINSYGWQAALNSLTIIGTLILVSLLLSGNFQTQLFNSFQATELNSRVSIAQILPIMHQPRIWLNGLVGCFLYLPLSIFAELWGIPYLQAVYHLSPLEAAHAVANIFLGWAIGAPLIGLLVSKLPYQRTVLLLGSILTGTFLLILLSAKALTLVHINLLLLAIGLCNSSQVIILELAYKLNPPQYASTSIAFTNMLIMCGGAIVQPLVGWLLDIQGMHIIYHEMTSLTFTAYQHALLIIPLACFLAGFLTCFIRPREGKQQ